MAQGELERQVLKDRSEAERGHALVGSLFSCLLTQGGPRGLESVGARSWPKSRLPLFLLPKHNTYHPHGLKSTLNQGSSPSAT